MNLIHTRVPVSQAELRAVVHRIATRQEEWLAAVRYDAHERWYQRIERCDGYEIWLLSWLPGQHTGFHDHGSSAGAFAVAHGMINERSAPGGLPTPSAVTLGPGAVRSFGPRYVHDVRNSHRRPAVSVHAYSPPLTRMRRFEVSPGGLIPAEERKAGQW
jgi:predicted metal-dependent enzyme (double-stranded beta helix superfamily)